ncbi:membrane protein US9 [Equid alphaherpesvirus 3]|nr:membrane protein US9 [Equid alphaherpesvirus 3]AIL02984.1 membrane protein US9 [Equid alphaherpesvirus 3]
MEPPTSAVNENYEGGGLARSPPSPALVGLEATVAAPPGGYLPLARVGGAGGYDSDAGCYYSESDNETAGMFIRRVGRRQTSRRRRRQCALTVAGVALVVALCAISGVAGAFLARLLGP